MFVSEILACHAERALACLDGLSRAATALGLERHGMMCQSKARGVGVAEAVQSGEDLSGRPLG
jgi:hypothetical protein